MADKDELRKKMNKWAEESAQKADEILEDDLEKMKQKTSTDLDALRPKVSDKASYDKLIEAVGEATKKNESLAALKSRIVLPTISRKESSPKSFSPFQEME